MRLSTITLVLAASALAWPGCGEPDEPLLNDGPVADAAAAEGGGLATETAGGPEAGASADAPLDNPVSAEVGTDGSPSPVDGLSTDGPAHDGSSADGPVGGDSAGADAGDATASDAGDAAPSGGHCGCPAGHKRCLRGEVVLCVPEDPQHSCSQDNCTACHFPHAYPGCAEGRCAIARCHEGWGDCNQDPTDGCEADLTTRGDCGRCGHACGPQQRCTKGVCLDACSAPLTDCGTACVDTSSDPLHCGGCGAPCGSERPACVSGRCRARDACDEGLALCNTGDPYFGCANLKNDPEHCGRCENRCPWSGAGATCKDGVCVPCPPGLTACGNLCVDTNVDAEHCGACNERCLSHACSAGRCTSEKQSVLLAIDQELRDFAMDQDWIYFTTPATVAKVKKSGGAPVVLAREQTDAYALALDDSFVYVANHRTGIVVRVDKNGGPAVTLGTVTKPTGIVLVGDSFYIPNESGIWRLPKTGGTATSVLTVEKGVAELLHDSGSLLFRTATGLGQLPLAGGSVQWLFLHAGQERTCESIASWGAANGFLYWSCRGPYSWSPFSFFRAHIAPPRLVDKLQVIPGAGSFAVVPDGMYYVGETGLHHHSFCSQFSRLLASIGGYEILVDDSFVYVRWSLEIHKLKR